MPEIDMISIGEALPVLASVTAGNGPYIVLIDWAEGSRAGTSEAIDLAPVILTYKAFKPLRDDPALFATVRLSEYADAIEWGPDDSLAVSGATLERLAEEVMTSAHFAEFMRRNNLTLNAAAAQLGISRRMVAYYAKERTVPRYIALACKQLERELAQPASGQGAAVERPRRTFAGGSVSEPISSGRDIAGHFDVAWLTQLKVSELAEKIAKAGSVGEAVGLQDEFVGSVLDALKQRTSAADEPDIGPSLLRWATESRRGSER